MSYPLPETPTTNRGGPLARLLFLISILLPIALLGIGYYLTSIPEGTILVGVRQNVWFGVGQSIIASALVTLLMLLGTWADRLSTEEQSNLALRSLVEYLSTSEKMKRTGLRQIHSDRYIRPVYQAHQERAAYKLDILGMSLKHFQQDVGDQLLHWVNERPNLIIRVIILNPNSIFGEVRDLEEGGSLGEIADSALRLTQIVLTANHPRIQIRWHNTLPTANLYRLDDVIFLGPYLIGRLSRLTTTLEIDANGQLAVQYLQHFENLWEPSAEHKDWSQVPTLDDVRRFLEDKRKHAI